MRAIYLMIAMAMTLGLLLVPAVSADPGLSDWTAYTTPSDYAPSGWVVAPDSRIAHYGAGAGGQDLYAIGTFQDRDEIGPAGNATVVIPQLMKSTNYGATWKALTNKVLKEIRDRSIANEIDEITFLKLGMDPLNSNFMAVAFERLADDKIYVFVSQNGGASFRNTGDISDVGWELTELMFLSVSVQVDDEHDIALSGIASDGMMDKGVVFRYETGLGAGWEDATQYDGWDDFTSGPSVAAPYFRFAPSWATDYTVLVTTVTSYPAPCGSYGRGVGGVSLGDVYLQTGTWGRNMGWNGEVGYADAVPIVEDVFIPALAAATAGMTIPVDYAGRYSSKRYLWINVNYIEDTDLSGTPTSDDTPMGVIFKVVDDDVSPILQQVKDNPWLASVQYWGYIDEGMSMAGLMGTGEPAMMNYGCGSFWMAQATECDAGVQVYRNDTIEDMDICCKGWKASCKPPSGTGNAGLFFVSDTLAFCPTIDFQSYMGDESAWSVSFDNGETWNQLSFVDTQIDYFSDVARSPNCNKTFLVSINEDTGCAIDSVWMRAGELAEADIYNNRYLRTWYGWLTADEGLIRLAPEEDNGETVYLVDRWNNIVYWNDTETLACWEEGHATIDTIVDLAVKDEATIYALDEDNSVAVSDDHGATATWEDPVDSLVDEGHTIAVLGDDVLVGGGYPGYVAHSSDAGETFTKLTYPIPADVAHVAFDSYFTDNNTIFAAGNDLDGEAGGIYRWVIGESRDWFDLNADNMAYYGIVLDRADGNPETDADHGSVLYASYYDPDEENGGVARLLTPASTPCCRSEEWSYLEARKKDSYHLMFTAEPSSLKICGCLTSDSNSKLYAIDMYDPYNYPYKQGRVWEWEDCFAKAAPKLVSPADGIIARAAPCQCTNDDINLKWDRLCNACKYKVYVSTDSAVATEILPGYPVTIQPPSGASPSYVIPNGELETGTTYYWRVVVYAAETELPDGTWQVVDSFKSSIRSFTVAGGLGAAVTLTAPDDGATNAPLTGVSFTWTNVPDATAYDWVLSANADLSSPLESKSGLTTTAYTYTGNLDNSTPYYWQVTVKKGDTMLSQSSVSTFTTLPTAPAPPPPAPEPTTPFWVWLVIGIGAVLVIVVIVLIFRTRRV